MLWVRSLGGFYFHLVFSLHQSIGFGCTFPWFIWSLFCSFFIARGHSVYLLNFSISLSLFPLHYTAVSFCKVVIAVRVSVVRINRAWLLTCRLVL